MAENARLGVILTARMSSQRFPGKVLAPVAGQPLLFWLARAYSRIGKVVIATSYESADDALARQAADWGYPVFRGSLSDVCDRIVAAGRRHLADCAFWLRGMGDCPFPELAFIRRATQLLAQEKREAFLWALPPWSWPVYGSREFPLSQEAWLRLERYAREDEREHPDLYFHRHRDQFCILYHMPPPPWYFRPYRLEVDYPEDMAVVRGVVAALGGEEEGKEWPGTAEAIKVLETHQRLAKLDLLHRERTGPQISFNDQERSRWLDLMAGQPLMDWDGTWWQPPRRARPLFCQAGCCLLGAVWEDRLILPDGSCIIGKAHIRCACGAGRRWYPAS